MFDSHAHVDHEAFDVDRDDVIARVFESGVSGWMEVGTNLELSKTAIVLAEKYPNVFASVGAHPHEIVGLSDQHWDEFSFLADNPIVKAIGEVGLDFSRGDDVELQEHVLRRFVELAQKKHLPVIFHVRSGKNLDAHTELIRILRSYNNEDRPRGVIHTFSGNSEQANEYIGLGLYISFSGVITFKNAGDLPAIATTMPLERMLVETDCPYLTPDPFRGKRNDPSFVRYVVQKIADLRNTSFEDVEKITEQNARNLFLS